MSGLFAQNRCPRGKNCNFLHVYRNPDDWNEQRSENLRYHRYTRSHEDCDKKYYSGGSTDCSRKRNGVQRSRERDFYGYDHDRDYKNRRRKYRSKSRDHSDDDNYRRKKRRHRSRSASEERDEKQSSRTSVPNGKSIKENETNNIKDCKDISDYNIQSICAKSRSPCDSDSDRYQHCRKAKKKHKKHKRRSNSHRNTANISDDNTT